MHVLIIKEEIIFPELSFYYPISIGLLLIKIIKFK